MTGHDCPTCECDTLDYCSGCVLAERIAESEAQVSTERERIKRILHPDAEQTFVGLWVEENQENTRLRARIAELEAQLTESQAKLAAAGEDTARLDWLFDTVEEVTFHIGDGVRYIAYWTVEDPGHQTTGPAREDWRQAIDAARNST